MSSDLQKVAQITSWCWEEGGKECRPDRTGAQRTSARAAAGKFSLTTFPRQTSGHAAFLCALHAQELHTRLRCDSYGKPTRTQTRAPAHTRILPAFKGRSACFPYPEPTRAAHIQQDLLPRAPLETARDATKLRNIRVKAFPPPPPPPNTNPQCLLAYMLRQVCSVKHKKHAQASFQNKSL